MKILHPNKTRSQASVAINSGFFWSDNKEIEFEKRTVINGVPFIETHKGIILKPYIVLDNNHLLKSLEKAIKKLDEAEVPIKNRGYQFFYKKKLIRIQTDDEGNATIVEKFT